MGEDKEVACSAVRAAQTPRKVGNDEPQADISPLSLVAPAHAGGAGGLSWGSRLDPCRSGGGASPGLFDHLAGLRTPSQGTGTRSRVVAAPRARALEEGGGTGPSDDGAQRPVWGKAQVESREGGSWVCSPFRGEDVLGCETTGIPGVHGRTDDEGDTPRCRDEGNDRRSTRVG